MPERWEPQRFVRSELGEFRIDKKLLKKTIREAMRSRFGKVVGTDQWRHASPVRSLRSRRRSISAHAMGTSSSTCSGFTS